MPFRKESLGPYLGDEARKVPNDGYLGVLPCEDRESGLYPNVDLSIWLRSCISEQEKPLEGIVKGQIPEWILGSFLQNGPGKFFYGDKIVRHLFDGAALVQKYHIEEGKVMYQCRYLRTEAFKKNLVAKDVTINEFATPGTNKDGRLAFIGDLGKIMSDNTFISVYPLGQEYYCYYESPFIQRVDPDTLFTLKTINLNKHWNVLTNASHPHFDDYGNLLSLGMKVGTTGPEYIITKTKVDDDNYMAILDNKAKGDHYLKDETLDLAKFDESQIVAKVKSRWMMDPSYMHSFSVTENYYVIVEQPMTVNVPSLIAGTLKKRPMINSMRWKGESTTLFHVVHKVTGERIKMRYRTKAFFFLHTINAYEDEGHIVIDICSFSKPDMLYCMYLEALQKAQSNPDYAELFRGRPQRYVLPLKVANNQHTKRDENLVTLSYTTAQAFLEKKRTIRLVPQTICDVGCETPTINYDQHNGKKYRYFYAITADVDDPVSAGQIHKIDTISGKVHTWCEIGSYCAEPMFVPKPDSQDEDDGVILSSIIRNKPEVNYTALLVLDAKTMTEIGRAEFRCVGPVPKPLHGYFTGNNVSHNRHQATKAKQSPLK